MISHSNRLFLYCNGFFGNMGNLCKFRCACGNEITYDVPYGEDTFNFGEKLPCGQCGQTGNVRFENMMS